ncbi:FHA domain-containing protein [Streptomyces sp. NPDC050743]|uniref:FHA domain-containing protein n=1 Tax=Streptomyces sp. NPDC050743 TaxID=3365634 RepID=UPI0037BC8C38
MITDPAQFRNTALVLTGARQVVGRAPGCDLRLEHPHVSGRHAELSRSGAQVLIEDLSSTNGTYVNGSPVRGPQRLYSGDTISFGDVRARFDDPAQSITQTAQAPAFNVRSQQAGSINNVGRDQYIQEAQQSFLKEVAAARSKGRRLILVGFLLAVGGFAVFAWGVLRFMGVVSRGLQQPVDSADPSSVPSFDDLGTVWGDQIGGVPIFLFGWVAAAIGIILMIVGLVLHVIAAARRRAYERMTFYP